MGWLQQVGQAATWTEATKGAGTLRRAVRSQAFAKILGGRHMECAYYFVNGTWNVPTTLTLVGL